MDLSQLLEARQGRPTERQAARKIATFAVIPAAILGLLAGTQLVDVADPIGRLLWVCTATALGAGFGAAFLVLGLFHLFGFRLVALIADALVGSFIGLLCGGALTMLLLWSKLVHPNHALLALLLIPLGAVVVPLWRAWSGKSPPCAAAGQAAAAPDGEPGADQDPLGRRI